jgi:uncharacterized protein YgiM (DUF1202 family)
MKLNLRRVSILLLLSMVLGVFGNVVYASENRQQPQYAVPILVVNTSFFNVRTGPGVQYTILATVVGGTELPVLAVADDRVWYLVATPVGNGWANVEYTLPRGDFRNVPLLDPAVVVAPLVVPSTPVTIGLPVVVPAAPVAVANQPAAGVSGVERFRAVINVEAVNLRAQPSDESASLTTLFRDNAKDYPIVGRTNVRGIEWLAINVPGAGSGWVPSGKLFLRLSANYRTVLQITAQVVALTRSPGGDSTGLPILTEGREVFLINISPDSQFIQVELGDGTVGWVPFSATQGRTGTPTDDPEGRSPQQRAQQAGQQPSVVIGAPVVVQPAAPAIQLPRAIVNTGNLNIRSGPGGQYTVVATVPGGTELVVIGVVEDREWYLVQGSFGQGWLDKDYALFRGVFDYVPLVKYSEAGVGSQIAAPVAIVSSTQPLYAAPGTQFAQVGVFYAPAEATIVARTADFSWIQLNTQYGYGWIPASQASVRGDASLIPVIS